MSAVAKQYIVSALFRNILTCLYAMVTQHPNSFRLNLQYVIFGMISHIGCLPTFIAQLEVQTQRNWMLFQHSSSFDQF